MMKSAKQQVRLSSVFVLILLLAFTPLFSACGDPGGSDSSEALSAASSSIEGSNAESKGSSIESTNSSTNSMSSATGSQTSTVQSSVSTSSNSSGKNVFSADPYSEIPARLKGSTVKVLMWTNVWAAEKAAAQAFTNKTGIKHEFIITTTDQYMTKLASLVAAKDSPDVFVMQPRGYVAMTTKLAQALDPKIFRLDDPIWGKEDMNAMRLKNGRYYSVNIPGSWLSSDTIYCLYYNKSLFEREGITTPEELQKAGNWNWDTLYSTCVELKSYDYNPLFLGWKRLFMLSAGTDFVTFKNWKFENNIGNATLENAWKFNSKMEKEGLLAEDTGFANFANGRTAMVASIIYGMRKDSGWGIENMKDKIGVVPIPAPKGMAQVAPHDVKTWGVALGAKNVEGAAFFLRYWLDPKNYDMASTFLNADFANAFSTFVSMKKNPLRSFGVMGMTNPGALETLSFELQKTSEDQINALLQQRKNIVQAAVDKANSALSGLK